MVETKLMVFFNSTMLFIAMAAEYAGLNVEAIKILGLLVAIDFTTGILKALVSDARITSRRMIRGLLSKPLLLVIPFIVGVAGIAIDINAGPLVNTTMNLLILSEVYSIIGNLYAIKTGKNTPEMDVIAILLKKIQGIMAKLTD